MKSQFSLKTTPFYKKIPRFIENYPFFSTPTWVPIWGPGSPWGPFSDFGSPLGPHFVFKVPIFSSLGLRTSKKSVQPTSNIEHLIIQYKWHKHCALNDNTLSLCEYIYFFIPLYLNELACFGQFFVYSLFGSPFLLPRVPIWSPFHSNLGPH